MTQLLRQLSWLGYITHTKHLNLHMSISQPKPYNYKLVNSDLSEDILWMPPASAFCTSRLLVWTIACSMVRTTCALLTTALQLASFLVRSCISLAASDTVLLSPPLCCCTFRNLTISGSAFAVSSVDPYGQCR